jgi:hypothetical protein
MSSVSNHEVLVAIALVVAACGNGTRPAEDVPDRTPRPARLDAAPVTPQPAFPDADVKPKKTSWIVDEHGNPPDADVEERLVWFHDEHGTNSSAMDWLVEHADRAHPFVRKLVEVDDGGFGFDRVVVVLGRMSYEEDVPLLLGKLDEIGERGLWEITQALAHHRSEAAYEALVTLAESDDEDRAQNAAFALGDRGDERARPILEQLLESESKSRRWGALKGLMKLGVVPSRAKLKARLEVEKDGEMKRELKKALAQ